MRNLAREFDGWMEDGEGVTQLRLLPQPIVRYQAPDCGVIDGAWRATPAAIRHGESAEELGEL